MLHLRSSRTDPHWRFPHVGAGPPWWPVPLSDPRASSRSAWHALGHHRRLPVPARLNLNKANRETLYHASAWFPPSPHIKALTSVVGAGPVRGDYGGPIAQD